jgi:hypothetical protein
VEVDLHPQPWHRTEDGGQLYATRTYLRKWTPCTHRVVDRSQSEGGGEKKKCRELGPGLTARCLVTETV